MELSWNLRKRSALFHVATSNNSASGKQRRKLSRASGRECLERVLLCEAAAKSYSLLMSITATVENGIVRLPAGVPDGTQVEITWPDATVDEHPQSAGSFFASIRDLIGKADGLPEDFAAEHDHYIHGTPRRVR